MSKIAIFVIGIAALSLSGPAFAQVIVTGPGTYSTYGNQTYGPNGAQSTYGNQTYLNGQNGQPSTTYSTYGNQTYGSDGSSYSTYGNTIYGNNGTTSQTYGNQTYIHGPNGRTEVCSQYGSQTYCH